MNSPLKVRTIARDSAKGKSRVGEAGLSAVENEEISRAGQKRGEMITQRRRVRGVFAEERK
jgi:hypothetical protein